MSKAPLIVVRSASGCGFLPSMPRKAFSVTYSGSVGDTRRRSSLVHHDTGLLVHLMELADGKDTLPLSFPTWCTYVDGAVIHALTPIDIVSELRRAVYGASVRSSEVRIVPFSLMIVVASNEFITIPRDISAVASQHGIKLTIVRGNTVVEALDAALADFLLEFDRMTNEAAVSDSVRARCAKPFEGAILAKFPLLGAMGVYITQGTLSVGDDIVAIDSIPWERRRVVEMRASFTQDPVSTARAGTAVSLRLSSYPPSFSKRRSFDELSAPRLPDEMPVPTLVVRMKILDSAYTDAVHDAMVRLSVACRANDDSRVVIQGRGGASLSHCVAVHLERRELVVIPNPYDVHTHCIPGSPVVVYIGGCIQQRREDTSIITLCEVLYCIPAYALHAAIIRAVAPYRSAGIIAAAVANAVVQHETAVATETIVNGAGWDVHDDAEYLLSMIPLRHLIGALDWAFLKSVWPCDVSATPIAHLNLRVIASTNTRITASPKVGSVFGLLVLVYSSLGAEHRAMLMDTVLRFSGILKKILTEGSLAQVFHFCNIHVLVPHNAPKWEGSQWPKAFNAGPWPPGSRRQPYEYTLLAELTTSATRVARSEPCSFVKESFSLMRESFLACSEIDGLDLLVRPFVEAEAWLPFLAMMRHLSVCSPSSKSHADPCGFTWTSAIYTRGREGIPIWVQFHALLTMPMATEQTLDAKQYFWDLDESQICERRDDEALKRWNRPFEKIFYLPSKLAACWMYFIHSVLTTKPMQLPLPVIDCIVTYLLAELVMEPPSTPLCYEQRRKELQ